MKQDVKKQYIEWVYKLLQTEGVSGVSIRRVANEVGCNSATLYRYFNDLEHLICIASVKYLEPYIEDIKNYSSTIINPVELNLKLWERFSFYAFHNADIFETIFFGSYSTNLMELMYEYYEIYASNFSGLDGFAVSFIFNSDIFERDYMFYRRAANMGYLSPDASRLLAQTGVYMFHGLLIECRKNDYSMEELDCKASEFISNLTTIVNKFLLK